MRKMSVLFALTFAILAAMPAAAQRRVSAEGRVTNDRGRKIEVEGRSIGDDRHRHIELNDIHRGDYITLRGRWERGTFSASRIENISAR